MNCTTCNKPSKMNAPKAVVEINNSTEVVLFHKVPFPASMGDENTNPPDTLDLKNVILEYEATGTAYLYSSDGVPTRLTPDLRAGIQYNDLVGRPKYAGLPMSSKTVIPVVPTDLAGLSDGNRVTILETEVETNSGEIETLTGRVSNLTTELQSATNQIAENTTNIANEVTAREQAVAEVAGDLNAEVNTREQAIADLQSQIDAGSGGGGDVSAEIAALQASTAQLSGEVSTLQNSVTTNTTDIVTATTNIATLTSTVNGYSSDIAAATTTAEEAQSAVTNKQDTLVSGTNIKTVNGESLLGSGDLAVPSNIYPEVINVSQAPEAGSALTLQAGTYVLCAYYAYSSPTQVTQNHYLYLETSNPSRILGDSPLFQQRTNISDTYQYSATLNVTFTLEETSKIQINQTYTSSSMQYSRKDVTLVCLA